MAAVLALGDGAMLSHRSAAMLWRMLEPAAGLVHVTVLGNNGRERRRGIVVHRSSTLCANATAIRDGIPVTGPARTLADLRRAPDKAEYRLCGRHRLPRPKVNQKVGPFTADFLWREQKVVVETDTYGTHGGIVSFEEDRQRDMWLSARGYRVVRVADKQLAADPRGVASSLRAILDR